MDGTLLATDALWESLLLLIKTQPRRVLALPFWLLKGKAYFKRQLAQCVRLNPASLPYRENVLAFLKKEYAAGREIVLATASDKLVAENVANHLGIFSEVLASEGKTNLSGARKSIPATTALIISAMPKSTCRCGRLRIAPIWLNPRRIYLTKPARFHPLVAFLLKRKTIFFLL
jgi:hypothetical protein